MTRKTRTRRPTRTQLEAGSLALAWLAGGTVAAIMAAPLWVASLTIHDARAFDIVGAAVLFSMAATLAFTLAAMGAAERFAR